MTFEHLKPGDHVERRMGSNGPLMTMVVVRATDTLVYCDQAGRNASPEGLWTFDRKTGVEEDEDLGWGVKFGKTGTYLTRPPE